MLDAGLQFVIYAVCVMLFTGFILYVGKVEKARRETRGLSNFPGSAGQKISIAGASLGFLNFLMPYMIIVAILGVVLLLYGWKGKGKESHKLFAMVMGGIFLMLTFVAVIPGPGIDDTGNCTSGQVWNPNTQKCEVKVTGSHYNVEAPTTAQGGGRDLTTEIFNDGTGSWFSLDCVADTPDGTLGAFATNLFIQSRAQNNIRVSWQYTVDQGAATSAAGFAAPDCFSMDLWNRPKQTIDSNGDGASDNQLLWGRVADIGKTRIKDVNLTESDTIFSTVTEGYYVAWMREDADQTGSGQVVSACPGSVGKIGSLSTSDCNQWVFLGDTTGDGFYTAFQMLYRSQTPPFYYTSNAVGDAFTIVLEFSGNEMTVDATVTITVSLAVLTAA